MCNNCISVYRERRCKKTQTQVINITHLEEEKLNELEKCIKKSYVLIISCLNFFGYGSDKY